MYRNLNDYEILYTVSESNESYNVLCEKYKPLIYKYAHKYFSLFKQFGYEIEDLMQIGYMALYKASMMYSFYNNSLFYTYFKKALDNAFKTELKVNQTLKKEVLNKSLSYDANIKDTELNYIDVLPDKHDNYENIDNEKKYLNFKNSLPFELGCIFEMYYNGFSKEEISVLLDKKIEDVKKSLCEIKRHALTHKYLFLN